MSEPTPRSDPRMAMRAPSPPLLPPDVRLRLCGFAVRPKMTFEVSVHMSVCGTFVRQMKTAPAARRICAMTASSLLMSPSQATKPMLHWQGQTTLRKPTNLGALDLDLILEADWQAVQRAYDLAGALEMCIEGPGLLER